MIIKPEDPPGLGSQYSRIGKQFWSVTRLIDLSKDLPVMEVPIACLVLEHDLHLISLRELARHVLQVNRADLSYPLILDEDGVIMDGRHRLTKAIIEQQESIKVVRFEINPEPCKTDH